MKLGVLSSSEKWFTDSSKPEKPKVKVFSIGTINLIFLFYILFFLFAGDYLIIFFAFYIFFDFEVTF